VEPVEAVQLEPVEAVQLEPVEAVQLEPAEAAQLEPAESSDDQLGNTRGPTRAPCVMMSLQKLPPEM
jgi:hypothetical protein